LVPRSIQIDAIPSSNTMAAMSWMPWRDQNPARSGRSVTIRRTPARARVRTP